MCFLGGASALASQGVSDSFTSFTNQAKNGLKAYKVKNYKLCVQSFRTIVEELPVSGLFILSKCLKEERQYKEAHSFLKTLLLRSPQYKPALYLQAELFFLEGQYQEATKIYNALIKKHPKTRKHYDLLIETLLQQKNFTEARTLILETMKIFGKNYFYTSELCRIYIKEKFAKEALKICQDALRMKPQDPHSLVHLAEAYALNDQERLAERTYLIASKKFSKSELVQRRTGDFYFLKKNFILAYKYYKKAYQNHRDSLKALKGVALSAFELKKYKEALEACVRICKEDPLFITEDFLRFKSYVVGEGLVQWEKPYRTSFEACVSSQKPRKNKKV